MNTKRLAVIGVLALVVIGCVVAAGCTTTSVPENTDTISVSTEALLNDNQIDENSLNPYMLLAIDEANKGMESGDGGPIGAVIVKDGVVVGKGHNCIFVNNDPTAHGEIMAIRDAGKNLNTYDLSGCDLYTTSEPCPMCMTAIFVSNIDNVYYGCTVDDSESIMGWKDKENYEILATQEDHGEEVDREACLLLYEKYNNMT